MLGEAVKKRRQLYKKHRKKGKRTPKRGIKKTAAKTVNVTKIGKRV